jgi:putative addiction module killer protein
VTEVFQTEIFVNWLESLRDKKARTIIVARIRRFAFGNPGDISSVGDGVSEMRIHFGPGYRVYFVQRGLLLTILLCGGDKSSQSRDIKIAKKMANELEAFR